MKMRRSTAARKFKNFRQEVNMTDPQAKNEDEPEDFTDELSDDALDLPGSRPSATCPCPGKCCRDPEDRL
jgi:hypothetical protein